jgi:FdrA protein
LGNESPTVASNRRGGSPQTQVTRGPVGIISTSPTGLQEMAWLLACEGVGTSRALHAGKGDAGPEAETSVMLTSLRALQTDPTTEVIVLVSEIPWPAAAEQILVQVRQSDKPAVICFLGADQRLVWQAGAIPAARLDEAALRAAAWVRGWDQALVSSRLEDEDEQLATLADGLRAAISSTRHRLRGVFSSGILCREAELMLAAIGGKDARTVHSNLTVVRSAVARLSALQTSLNDPEVAVILLDLVVGRNMDPDQIVTLASVLREERGGPTIIAHPYGTIDPLSHLANQEDNLRDLGVVLAFSNAAAARLAAMVVRGRGKG